MRSKKTLLILSLTMIFLINAYSQGISISETNSAPDPSAMLDVSSTTKGLLPPRLTSSQRIAMSAPASGLVVYDTDFNSLFVMTGEGWMRVDYGDKWQKDEDNYLTYNQGNVGIGITYPEAKLEVNGQVKINGGSPAEGKVLTSDAAGLASWQHGPLSILGSAQANGYSPLVSELSFVVVPATIQLTETANIMIHSTRGLGTLTTGVTTGLLNLFMCYRNTNGGSITTLGLGIYGLRIPANTRIPFSLSYSTDPLPPGTYQVGLCGTCADPAQWNSNEFSYTTAMAYKLPSGTANLSFNNQQTTVRGSDSVSGDAGQSSITGNYPEGSFDSEPQKPLKPGLSLEERLELLSQENEIIRKQLSEISRTLEKETQP